MKTRYYDFSLITVTDVEGEAFKEGELKPPYKVVAQKIYLEIQDIDLVGTAMAIAKGEGAELSTKEAKAIRKLICGPQSTVFAFIRKAVSDYMDMVESEKEEEQEE